MSYHLTVIRIFVECTTSGKQGDVLSLPSTKVRNKSSKLRVLMSNRDVIVKRLVSSINQLNRWVDIVFPELRQVFKDITAKGAIATLRLLPSPMGLGSMKPEEVVAGWKSLMKRQPGFKKAHLLFNVARNSVGTKEARGRISRFLLLKIETFEKLCYLKIFDRSCSFL
jgi:hypothetical protein